MSHFIEVCKICETVISQCRCPSPNKEKRYGLCCNCKVAIGEDNVLEDSCQPGDLLESRNGNLFLKIDNDTLIALGNKTLAKREVKDQVTIKSGFSVCRKVGKVNLEEYIDGQKVNW